MLVCCFTTHNLGCGVGMLKNVFCLKKPKSKLLLKIKQKKSQLENEEIFFRVHVGRFLVSKVDKQHAVMHVKMDAKIGKNTCTRSSFNC